MFANILPAARSNLTGLVLSLVIAAAATFISDHQGGPALLYALLLGMTLKSVAESPASKPGIVFSSRTVLRIGVALLGLKIGVAQVMALGLSSALLLMASVTVTIFFGIFLSQKLGLDAKLGLVTGGATAICGASAALAIGSLLPHSDENERNTTFAVVAITTLSTVAMIVYPALLHAVGAGDSAAGFYIGATVHDVAQVVGAGYMISPLAGDTATVTKLFRVAMLVPVTLVLASVYKPAATTNGTTDGAAKKPRIMLPWFLVVFVAFVALNSIGFLPASLIDAAGQISRWCLVTAIAGVGLKTSLGDFRGMGLRPLVLVFAETLFLAAFVALGAQLR